jgi:hypothetical protein
MSTTHVNRFVVGPDLHGRSAVRQQGLTNVQSREGLFWSATLWTTQETDEVLMQPGDTVIIRGVNHAWSNRSSAPCLLIGTNTDATPLDQH